MAHSTTFERLGDGLAYAGRQGRRTKQGYKILHVAVAVINGTPRDFTATTREAAIALATAALAKEAVQ